MVGRTFLPGALAAVLCLLWVGLAPAAAAPAPVWNVTQSSQPTNLRPGGPGSYRIQLENLGAVAVLDPVTVTDSLPPGVTATSAGDGYYWDCPGAAGSSVVVCNLIVPNLFPPQVDPHTSVPALVIQGETDDGVASTGENTVSVSGGGASDDSSTQITTFSDQPAGFGFAGVSGWAQTRAGSAAKQAGGHPDVTTDIDLNTITTPVGGVGPSGDLKDIRVELPKGLIGDPTAVPTCDPTALADVFAGPQCAPETQVGTADISLSFGIFELTVLSPTPVYNVEAPVGSPGRFAFNVNGVVVNLDPVIRTGGDYGITANVSRVSQSLAIAGTKLTLWGVPADPIHDVLRYNPQTLGNGVASAGVPKPFMTAPTECAGKPLMTRISGSSWQGGTASGSFDRDFDGNPIVTEGCADVPFEPGFVVRTESQAKRGAPAGIGVDLTVPQSDNPDGLASANLKTAKVTLPEGMVVNASSAQGLQACSPQQIDLNGASRPTCPNASKIGSIDIVTPLLDDPLTGGIYLASQKDNPFGTTLALYLVAEGSGVTLKLPGRIDADARTGRITTTFDDNPQLPFEKLSLHFKTGPRAPLSLPTTCGPATTTAVLSPWSGTAPVTINSSFEVSADGNGAPCPALGFSPGFTAGTVNATGGADSPFAAVFSRTDDDQQFGGVTVEMPKGLLGRIAGVDLCGDTQAAAGTCGEGSKIGNVTSAVGAGSNPFSLPGQVFITGPYKGAPFGLSIVVPAVAGPFNLGTVVVRAAIFVDRNTTQLKIVSDSLPMILEGIPLQIRLIEVDVDRPGFTFNPTNCNATSVEGAITPADGGGPAAVSSRFQVGNCKALDLKPKLALALTGKGQTTDNKHPALRATLTQPSGQANLKKVAVTLPLSLALDPDNANGLCEPAAAAADRCPASSIIGRASALTPVLHDPLTGPVYFVRGERIDAQGKIRKTLPKLYLPLRGENGVQINLRASSEVKGDRLVTTFDNIPDAPVSSFKLDINGGGHGVLVVSDADICKSTQIAGQEVDGQNNKAADAEVYIQTPSCPVKVISKTVGNTTVKLKVGGLGAGKVTASGKGIKKTTKTIAKSTVATITAKRTKGKPGKVTVSFDPAGPARARKATK
jgi:uncharacterized repeat protein (TIGR01451 family)